MCEEPLVSWDLAVCKVFVETKVRLVRWVSRVSLVSLVALGQWVSKDHSDLLELPVQSDFAVSKERPDLLVCVVHLEQLAQLAQLVCVARLEHKVSKASRDQLELRATPVLKV